MLVTIPPERLIFSALSSSILLLAWLCARYGLGRDVRLVGDEDARRLADEAVSGFVASEVALDAGGRGALLRDGAGRIMLLRLSGARFVARLLDRRARARCEGGALTIDSGEAMFGTTRLELGGAAAVWAQHLAAKGG